VRGEIETVLDLWPQVAPAAIHIQAFQAYKNQASQNPPLVNLT